MNRAVLPCLEVAHNKRRFDFNQIEAVREVKKLLEREISNRNPARFLQHEIADAPWIIRIALSSLVLQFVRHEEGRLTLTEMLFGVSRI